MTHDREGDMNDTIGQPMRLRTGAEYKRSLQDGRRVWYQGEWIEDVTTHPATARAIEFQASLYDAQHEPQYGDLLTYPTKDGTRAPTAWLAPREHADLYARLAESELRNWLSFGAMHARQPNHIASNHIGQLGFLSRFRELSPELADNLSTLVQRCEDENLHVTGSIVEPQGTRARSAKAGDDRSAVARVVRRDADGIYISGAKAVGTAAAQANELVLGSIYYPHVRADEAFWCQIPLNSPGLKLICRDAVAASVGPQHPVAQIGEEMDALILLDEVHVPYERVWSLGSPEACDPALFGMTARIEFWTHLTRAVVRAEYFAGLAQLVVDALELGQIPLVQDQIGEITQYAQILRGGLMAATESALPGPDGVLFPDGPMVSAFRIHALERWPHINHLVQQLCSQGLVSRFSEADYEAHGDDFEKYLATSAISARDKNVLMGLAWDLTSSSMAGRTTVFENVNGLPPSIMRHMLFFTFDRTPFADRIRRQLGLSSPHDSDKVVATASDAWIASRSRGEAVEAT